MYLTELLFCDKRKFKRLNGGLNDTKGIKKEISYIDTLLIYNTLWYKFSNDFDTQRDFGKILVTKNFLTWTILIFKYALAFKEQKMFTNENYFKLSRKLWVPND